MPARWAPSTGAPPGSESPPSTTTAATTAPAMSSRATSSVITVRRRRVASPWARGARWLGGGGWAGPVVAGALGAAPVRGGGLPGSTVTRRTSGRERPRPRTPWSLAPTSAAAAGPPAARTAAAAVTASRDGDAGGDGASSGRGVGGEDPGPDDDDNADGVDVAIDVDHRQPCPRPTLPRIAVDEAAGLLQRGRGQPTAPAGVV